MVRWNRSNIRVILSIILTMDLVISSLTYCCILLGSYSFATIWRKEE